MDGIVGVLFRHAVSLALGTSVALLQIGRTPRNIEVVDRYGPLLGSDSRTELLRRTEEDAHLAGVHRCEEVFACFVGRRFLNEADFMRRDAVILDELAFYLGVNIPFGGLVSRKVAEYELRAFGRIVTVVKQAQFGSADAGLVSLFIAVGQIYQTHVERHFVGVIGCDKHFGSLFPTVERLPAEQRGIAVFGELHQLRDKCLLCGCHGNIHQLSV